jgi:hypothetical protein
MPEDLQQDLYRIWSDRVKVAKEYHRRYMLEPIEEVERVWRGLDKAYVATPDLEYISVNLIYANSKVVTPQIWFANPEIIVEPLTDRMEEIDPVSLAPKTVDVVRNAELVKPVLEQKIEQIGFKKEEQKVARDTYLFGMGIMKEGWGSQFGKVGQKRLPKDATASDKVQNTPVTGINQNVMPDQPWCLRVHPRDIFLPSWARSYDELEFIIHRITRRVSDVKTDTRYKNTEGIQGTRLLYERDGRNRPASYEQQEDFVELWEIHYRTAADPKKDPDYEPGTALYKVLVLAEGHEEVLYHDLDEIAMAVGHFPFRFVVLSEDPDRIYPNSDVRQVLDQQREICKLRSYNLEVVKRQPAKTLIGVSALADERQMEALQQNLPVSYLKVNDPNGISVLQYPSISKDNWMMQDRLAQDFRLVSGVGENQQGTATNSTATEASIVQSNLNVRTADMLDKLKDHATGCFYDIFALLTEFANDKEIVRIDSQKGAQWREWTGKDIRGRYRFKLDVTQMQPPNNAVRKKMAFDFMNVALSQPQYFNIPEVVRQVAKTFTDVFPNVDALIRESVEPNQSEEILAMLNGSMAGVEPWHNHGEHLLVLEQWMQSPAAAMAAMEAQAMIAQHAEEHRQSLSRMGSSSGKIAAGSPQAGMGMMPAAIANKTPTEASIMAGANGGRLPRGF